jgi:dehydrogenase/reductase SDR family protein 1
MAQDLLGKVALVTGSSKGIGKGIALELGEQGATVYLTARTLEPTDDNAGLRAAAAEIDELGGTGVALQCDHGDDAQVEAVFAQIHEQHGALDILVNNASPNFAEMVGKHFWDIPFWEMDACLDIGPRSTFVATSLAVRAMIPRRSGLIVNVSSHGSQDYILSVPYGAGKAGIDKVTADTALELREHNIAAISLWPGLVMTERVVRRSIVNDDGGLVAEGLELSFGESPRFSGRAIVALATDPDIMTRTGKAFAPSCLAREYGFTDVDGSLPPEVRNLAALIGEENVPPFWKLVNPYPSTMPADQ